MVVLFPRQAQVRKAHRIEIVVRQRHEADAPAAQFYDLPDYRLKRSLARSLPIRPPNRAERAVLRASSRRLHRAPHVLALRQQIPARLRKPVRLQPAALVYPFQPALRAIPQRLTPCDIAIAPYHGIGRAILERLFRVQRRMHAPKHHSRSAFVRDAPHLVPSQRIQRMHANSDNIASLNRLRVKRLKCLVHDPWNAKLLGRRRRKHK